MAKLSVSSKSGFNAGDSYNVKFIRIEQIVIDPEFAELFKPSETTIDDIAQKIIKEGFHKEEPVSLWGRTLVDGNQRYKAAIKAGELEIPYVEKEFTSREEAMLYAFERQAVRRNLTDADILSVLEKLPIKKNANGDGNSSEKVARQLGKSRSTIDHAKAAIKHATEEELQDVRDGKTTLKKLYKKHHKTTIEISLKEAVIMLVQHDKVHSAVLLTEHFFKGEKSDFYDLLPETIKLQISSFAPVQ